MSNNVVTSRLAYLDGWRGLAILLVLESHFFHFLPLNSGRLGVDFFFVLSGYLMSGILFIKKQPLKLFYKRRISRIIPVFFLFCTCLYVFLFLMEKHFTAEAVVSTFLFLRTYLPIEPGIWDSGLPIGHLWSLNIEEHCYIIMSLFVLFRTPAKYQGFLLCFLGIGCICMGILYVKIGNAAPHWGELGTEVAASHLMLSAGYRLLREKFIFTCPRYLPLMAIIAAVICYSKISPWWSAPLLSPFLLAFAVNHIADTYDNIKTLLSRKVITFIGTCSYSIYLWQQPFYTYKEVFLESHLVALFCAIGVAMLSFHIVEMPVRTWLNRNW